MAFCCNPSVILIQQTIRADLYSYLYFKILEASKTFCIYQNVKYRKYFNKNIISTCFASKTISSSISTIYILHKNMNWKRHPFIPGVSHNRIWKVFQNIITLDLKLSNMTNLLVLRMSRMWLMSGWTSSAQVSQSGCTMKLMKPTCDISNLVIFITSRLYEGQVWYDLVSWDGIIFLGFQIHISCFWFS